MEDLNLVYEGAGGGGGEDVNLIQVFDYHNVMEMEICMMNTLKFIRFVFDTLNQGRI